MKSGRKLIRHETKVGVIEVIDLGIVKLITNYERSIVDPVRMHRVPWTRSVCIVISER